MGIKNVRKATYVSDTGKEFELCEMTSSHIINVIAHHQKQLGVLETIPVLTNLPEQENVNARIRDMRETIDELYRELVSRDPARDDEIQPNRSFNSGY